MTLFANMAMEVALCKLWQLSVFPNVSGPAVSIDFPSNGDDTIVDGISLARSFACVFLVILGGYLNLCVLFMLGRLSDFFLRSLLSNTLGGARILLYPAFRLKSIPERSVDQDGM